MIISPRQKLQLPLKLKERTLLTLHCRSLKQFYSWVLVCSSLVCRVASVRENQGKCFPSGKSGNFNIFCRESGKVRENDLISDLMT